MTEYVPDLVINRQLIEVSVTFYEALWRYLGWFFALSLIFGSATLRGLEGSSGIPRFLGVILLLSWIYSTYARSVRS